MKTSKDPKQKILHAALKEFASKGYGGARMDKIAKMAKINKAMLFYYFSSKNNLYQTAVKQAFSKIFPQVELFLKSEITPDQFLEKLPAIHFQFLAKNQDLMKIISFDLLHNHKNITRVIPEILNSPQGPSPALLPKLIKQWHKKGLITEPDPLNFLLNIISLNVFTFISKPIFEAVFKEKKISDKEFHNKRIKSIINLLKRGMLK